MFVSVFSQIWFVFEYFSTEFTSNQFWSELLQDFWSKMVLHFIYNFPRFSMHLVFWPNFEIRCKKNSQDYKPKTCSTITSSLKSMKWYICPLRYHITFSFMIFKKIFTSKTVSTGFAVIGCPNMFVSVFSQIRFVFEDFSTEFTSTYFRSEFIW